VSISARRWPSKSCTCQLNMRIGNNDGAAYDLAFDRVPHLF
jgi:hypothetical protein